jgi:hypothetical protein
MVPEDLLGAVIDFVLAPSAAGAIQGERDVLLALAGISSPDRLRTAKAPVWVGHSSFEMAAAGLGSEPSMMTGDLLQEVVTESRVRWRFVSLYRVFEAAYLLGLRERFLRDFLAKPGQVVDELQGALGSELATFTKLVEERALEQSFESIRATADADTSNRLLLAIKRKKKGEGLSGWRQGVAYIYRLRCAIVHAGQSDVVFERFDDSEDGLELLMPALEDAVVKLLAIERI